MPACATDFVLDAVDEPLAGAIEALGLRVHVTDTIMVDDAARARLGAAVLRVARPGGAGTLAARSSSSAESRSQAEAAAEPPERSTESAAQAVAEAATGSATDAATGAVPGAPAETAARSGTAS